jgi:CRP/FNR family transcriptional regulator, cyclic AMP receptor protein
VTAMVGEPRRRLVHLLDACPELGSALTETEREAARREVTIRLEQLPRTGWSPERRVEAEPVTCMLVVRGVLLRQAIVGGVQAAELLGAGDVVHVTADAEGDLLGSAVAWTAIDGVCVGWIGPSAFAAMAPWPVLQAALVARATERARRQAVFQAICHHVRVDVRVLGLLWQLADRWGRVTPAGVVVPLGLTHDTIATLIGAQRPSVTTALGTLAERHLVERRDDGAWLLWPGTDAELARMFARLREPRTPEIEILEELPSPLADREVEHGAGRLTEESEHRIAARAELRQRSAYSCAEARRLQRALQQRNDEASQNTEA